MEKISKCNSNLIYLQYSDTYILIIKLSNSYYKMIFKKYTLNAICFSLDISVVEPFINMQFSPLFPINYPPKHKHLFSMAYLSWSWMATIYNERNGKIKLKVVLKQIVFQSAHLRGTLQIQ